VRRREDEPEEWKRVRRGWCLGDEAFRRELVEAMAEKVGVEHYGEERQETSEGKSEANVRAELKRRGWTDKTLKARAKDDREKVKMTERLRRETTMTLAWIGERLRMGTKTRLSHRGPRSQQAEDQRQPRQPGLRHRPGAHKMAQEAPGHTLQSTALVHQAW
jgi:hypothetical protein